MEKIYIVTDGYYSDYRIIGVFSDKETADKLAEAYDYNSVEVYNIDLMADKLNQGLFRYRVVFDYDGTVSGIRKQDPVPDCMSENDPFVIGTISNWGRENCYTDMWARNEEHAVKIYSERRTMLLGTGLYPAEDAREGLKYSF